ncbi:MAG TPA: hypothetical protein VI451_07390 [Anaerolineales bacterium]|nr:hypothetical protein [Anaerolineales bacterium]
MKSLHDFDMARFLMESEVTQVFAARGVLVDKAIGAAGDIDIELPFAKTHPVYLNGVAGLREAPAHSIRALLPRGLFHLEK